LEGLKDLQKSVFDLTKKVYELEKKNSLDQLILSSQFKVLCFSGTSNGANLTLRNSFSEIQNRILIFKSFRIIPYYSADGKDIALTDGVTTNTETVYNNTRIERLFDFLTTGTRIVLEINGGVAPVFTVPGAEGYPLDLFIDNMYYKIPTPLQSINIRVTGTCVQDLTTGASATPNIKVIVECYLL